MVLFCFVSHFPHLLLHNIITTIVTFSQHYDPNFAPRHWSTWFLASVVQNKPIRNESSRTEIWRKNVTHQTSPWLFPASWLLTIRQAPLTALPDPMHIITSPFISQLLTHLSFYYVYNTTITSIISICVLYTWWHSIVWHFFSTYLHLMSCSHRMQLFAYDWTWRRAMNWKLWMGYWNVTAVSKLVSFICRTRHTAMNLYDTANMFTCSLMITLALQSTRSNMWSDNIFSLRLHIVRTLYEYSLSSWCILQHSTWFITVDWSSTNNSVVCSHWRCWDIRTTLEVFVFSYSWSAQYRVTMKEVGHVMTQTRCWKT